MVERRGGGGGSIKLFRRKRFVPQCLIFSYRNTSYFQKYRVSKNFMPMRGISHFSIEKLLSNSTEKLRRGTLQCFKKFVVSKKFMDKRGEEGE